MAETPAAKRFRVIPVVSPSSGASMASDEEPEPLKMETFIFVNMLLDGIQGFQPYMAETHEINLKTEGNILPKRREEQANKVDEVGRQKMLDYLFQLTLVMDYPQQTLFLAFQLLDKALSLTNSDMSTARVMGTVCLCLAAKQGECKETLSDFSSFLNYLKASEEPGQDLTTKFWKSERAVLLMQDNRLTAPTSFTFLMHYSTASVLHVKDSNGDDAEWLNLLGEAFCLASYCLQKTLSSYQATHRHQALLALAAWDYAVVFLGGDISDLPKFGEALDLPSEYQACYNEIRTLVETEGEGAVMRRSVGLARLFGHKQW